MRVQCEWTCDQFDHQHTYWVRVLLSRVRSTFQQSVHVGNHMWELSISLVRLHHYSCICNLRYPILVKHGVDEDCMVSLRTLAASDRPIAEYLAWDCLRKRSPGHWLTSALKWELHKVRNPTAASWCPYSVMCISLLRACSVHGVYIHTQRAWFFSIPVMGNRRRVPIVHQWCKYDSASTWVNQYWTHCICHEYLYMRYVDNPLDYLFNFNHLYLWHFHNLLDHLLHNNW